MKKITFLIGIITLIITGLGVYSCQKTETITPEELQRKEAVIKFENSLKAKSGDIKNLATDIFASRTKAFQEEIDGNELKEKQEEKAKQTLLPLLQDSKKLLLEYGIDDAFLKGEFGSTDDPRIIQLSLVFLSVEKNKKQPISQAGFLTISYDSESDYDMNKIMNCLGAALGVNEVRGLIHNTAELMTVEGTKRAVKLILKRYIGWAGVAVGVYSFGSCMDYW